MPSCRACRRPITDPVKWAGYGPDCAAKRGITPPSRPTVRASTPGDGQTALDFDQEDPMHVPDLDDYDGPLTAPHQVCTCAGTAPGYPMHEAGCGQPEPDEDESPPPIDWSGDIIEAHRADMARLTAENDSLRAAVRGAVEELDSPNWHIRVPNVGRVLSDLRAALEDCPMPICQYCHQPVAPEDALWTGTETIHEECLYVDEYDATDDEVE